MSRKREYDDDDDDEGESGGQVVVEDEAPRGKRSRLSTESKASAVKRQKKEVDTTISPLKEDTDISKERQKAADWAAKMGYGKKAGNLRQQPVKVGHTVCHDVTDKEIMVSLYPSRGANEPFFRLMLSSSYNLCTKILSSYRTRKKRQNQVLLI